MNIKKLMIFLFSLLFLLSSCTRDVSLEEKSITVKDEKFESSEEVEKAGEHVPEKGSAGVYEDKEAFYKEIVENTFSILDSSSVDTPDGTSFEETILEIEKGNVIGVYQSSDGSVSYLSYKFDEDRKGYVLNDGTVYSGELYIPALIGSSPVIEIADSAFKDNTKLTGSLYIPASVEVIGDYAFENCTGLGGSLILSPNLEEIGKYAFAGVTLTGDIVLPTALTTLDEGAFSSSSFNGSLFINDKLETIEDYTFLNTPLGGDLVIPEGVRRIGSHAFDSCAFDGALILSEGIESISDCAFANNALLHSDIYFPSTLKTLSYDAFDGCTSLNGSYFVNESGYVLVN